MSRLAAITGGTGFLGRHVTAAFAAAGWRLRLLVRTETMPPSGFSVDEAEVVRGSLADPVALAALVEGADAVIHLAGAIKARGERAFMAVNRDGTAALARTWRATAPGARLVFVSSLAAREPGLSHYAASKAAGEAALHPAAPCGAVVLRPCAIYGPGDHETLALFRAAGWPVQPVPNGAAARVALVHAGDVAVAVRAAAERDFPPGTYEISDARLSGYAWSEIVVAACAAVGGHARPVRMPRGVLSLFGLWGDVLGLVGTTPMLTSGKRREILHLDWSSSVAAQPPQRLWRPQYDIASGFRETVAWYRAAGWLRQLRHH